MTKFLQPSREVAVSGPYRQHTRRAAPIVEVPLSPWQRRALDGAPVRRPTLCGGLTAAPGARVRA